MLWGFFGLDYFFKELKEISRLTLALEPHCQFLWFYNHSLLLLFLPPPPLPFFLREREREGGVVCLFF